MENKTKQYEDQIKILKQQLEFELQSTKEKFELELKLTEDKQLAREKQLMMENQLMMDKLENEKQLMKEKFETEKKLLTEKLLYEQDLFRAKMVHQLETKDKEQKKLALARGIGERLKTAIDVYYGSQKKFAEIIGVNESTVSGFLSGSNVMSTKTADKIEELAKISKDYLYMAELPMVVDDTIKPIHEDIVIRSSVSKELKIKQDEHSTIRGIAKHAIHTKSGRREVLSSAGEANIVDIAYNGIKEVLLISMTVVEFCQKYKIEIGSTLVLDDEYQKGEIVYVDMDGHFILAEYGIDKIIDIYGNTEHQLTDEIKIIGKAYSRVERF
jgi:transcriptional regulator with XRE-family HTH domain